MEAKPVEYDEFTTESLLSIVSGRLLCQFGTVHGDIEKLAGFPVWTHQLPRVATDLKPLIFKACPLLETIVVDDTVTDDAARIAFIEGVWKEHDYKQFLPVPLVTPDAFVEPVAELEQMVGPDRVLTVAI